MPTRLTDLTEAANLTADDLLYGVAGGNSRRIRARAVADLAVSENRIINGAFDFWQRGTSFSSSGYGADRWVHVFVGGASVMSRQAFTVGDMLGQENPQFFLRQTVSGQSAVSDRAQIQQRIEGVRSFSGQTVTLLGWARRSSGAGNIAVEPLQYFGSGGSPSVTVTLPPQTLVLTTAFTPFALTFTVPSITGKTLGTNNDDSFYFNFWTSAGSNFNANTNSLGLQTIGVDLWGLHTKLGTHTVDAVNLYRRPDLAQELLRCQRYYWTSAPSFIELRGYQAAGTTFYSPITLPTRMRAQPACAIVSPTYGNASAGVAGGGAGGGQALFIQATATALGACSISTQITADAEL